MKLFVFEPSEHWAYMGGGIVILAECFENCQKLLDPTEDILYRTQEETQTPDYGWVLTAEFNCPDEKKEKLVMINYNNT